MSSLTQEQLLNVRDQHDSWLRAQPGVVGTGVGMDDGGTLCVKVFSNHMSPATREEIRARLADVPVAIQETGEIRKQAISRA